ncbi:MAG: TolB family protein [Bacteroidota bacterium]
MSKRLMLRALLVVSIAALAVGACGSKNPLVGQWTFHSTGGIYSDNCPASVEFSGDETVKVGGFSGTYKDMEGSHIMFILEGAGPSAGFQPGIVYEYAIRNDILSFKGQQFYCEYSSSLSSGDGPEAPVAAPQRSPQQNALLASVGGKGRIIFESTRGNLSHLYSMNPDGSELRPLAPDGVIGMSPDCSPDGKVILARDIGQYIFTINVDGTGRTNLLTTGRNFSPRWSPDGSRVVFAAGELGKLEIYLMNADGSGQTQLTSTGKDNLKPVWTPDGQIAFFAQTDKKYYTMGSDGGSVREITEETYADLTKEWAPDRSAYVAEMPGPFDIALFSPDGSVSVRLMEDEAGDFSPTWCP